ncbi:hypothetical protein [Thiohalocapsa sp.]|jgi:hypothetical protein|nr:hypothetical protein [Thiohalocapsa sp.]
MMVAQMSEPVAARAGARRAARARAPQQGGCAVVPDDDTGRAGVA